jgi:hypothetical protein
MDSEADNRETRVGGSVRAGLPQASTAALSFLVMPLRNKIRQREFVCYRQLLSLPLAGV